MRARSPLSSDFPVHAFWVSFRKLQGGSPPHFWPGHLLLVPPGAAHPRVPPEVPLGEGRRDLQVLPGFRIRPRGHLQTLPRKRTDVQGNRPGTLPELRRARPEGRGSLSQMRGKGMARRRRQTEEGVPLLHGQREDPRRRMQALRRERVPGIGREGGGGRPLQGSQGESGQVSLLSGIRIPPWRTQVRQLQWDGVETPVPSLTDSERFPKPADRTG